jgi:archaeosine synthase beta-subunit
VDDQIVDRDLLRRMRRLVATAGRLEPRSATPDREQLERFSLLPTRFRGRVTQRAVVALPTRGCRWFRPNGDACTHCGLIKDGLWDRELDWGIALGSLQLDLERVIRNECPVLCLYVAGSFFDDQELSPPVRSRVLQEVAKCGPVRQLVVECRPELIRLDSLRSAREDLGSIELVVGLGFDSVNRSVRALCLNKLTTERTYRQALEAVLEAGAKALTYIVLKPPFLDERTAVQEAIETGRFAFACGTSSVSVEPLAVQEGTLAHLLWKEDLHHPPRLWSLIEVLRSLHPCGEVLAGGSVVYPRSTKEPSNCHRCTQAVLAVIQEFNLTHDRRILDGPTCGCRSEWQQLMSAPATAVETQVATALAELERRLGISEVAS